MFKLPKSKHSYANVMKSHSALSAFLLGVALISDPSQAQPNWYKSDLEHVTFSTSQKTDFQTSGNNKSRYQVLALDTVNNQSSGGACDQSKKHSCDELVQDNILWDAEHPDAPYAKHWLQKNLDDLCSCTKDPYETVNCFQVQVNNKRKTWQEAIAICKANK
jgi:hypothetical protein